MSGYHMHVSPLNISTRGTWLKFYRQHVNLRASEQRKYYSNGVVTLFAWHQSHGKSLECPWKGFLYPGTISNYTQTNGNPSVRETANITLWDTWSRNWKYETLLQHLFKDHGLSHLLLSRLKNLLFYFCTTCDVLIWITINVNKYNYNCDLFPT